MSLAAQSSITAMATVVIIVNPCQVEDLSGLLQNSPIEYNLRTPAMLGADYSFTQTKDCGYKPTISVVGLPSFAIHNELEKNFSVESIDPAHESSSTVSVVATVSVPVTYEKATFNELRA